MGGKTWSRQEEHIFWQVIVPQSPKAVNPASRALNWEVCAHRMQERMGHEARRKYTKLMLFEHYFQNVATGHKSPHARRYVLEHKRQLERSASAAATRPRDTAGLDDVSSTSSEEGGWQPIMGSSC